MRREEVLCDRTGKPLEQCPFVEVPESRIVSEYEPSISHYQSRCEQCGQMRFHTVSDSEQEDKNP